MESKTVLDSVHFFVSGTRILDSKFLVGFRIPWTVFPISGSTNNIFPDSKFHKQKFPGFRIQIPLPVPAVPSQKIAVRYNASGLSFARGNFSSLDRIQSDGSL